MPDSTDITNHLHLRNVWFINYFDDYIGVALPESASTPFKLLRACFKKSGYLLMTEN